MSIWSDMKAAADAHRAAVTKRQKMRENTRIALAEARQGGHTDRVVTRETGNVDIASVTGEQPGASVVGELASMGGMLGTDAAQTLGATYGAGGQGMAVPGASPAASPASAATGGPSTEAIAVLLLLIALAAGGYLVTRG